MKNIVLYPGTFDPITNGHIDIISRAANLFDEVILAVGQNSNKTPLFTLEQRILLAERSLEDFDNVQVLGYDGLTTNFARECEANIILRGLRTWQDFEYEFQLNWMNKCLAPDLETIFLAPSKDVEGISSTLIREIAKNGGDYEQFVPSAVSQALEEIFAR